MTRDKNIEMEIADVLIEKPHPFSIGSRHFCLYPVTFAKMQLLARHIEALEVDGNVVQKSVTLEMLRLAQAKREECCRIIAIHTLPNTYEALYDAQLLSERTDLLVKELSDEEVATLLTMVFTSDKTEQIIHYLGIDKDQDNLRRVMKVKSDKNTLNFGGLSLFGSFIHPLKEMGYTDREILYEKSYAYLRLMLADKPNQVYLSDEERKKLPKNILAKDEDVILPTKENMEKIMSMDWR